jgi:hypothetical protein
MRFVSIGLGVIATGVVGAYACGGSQTPPANSMPVVTALGEGSAVAPLADVSSASAAPAASSAAAPTAATPSGATVLVKDLHSPNAVAVDKTHVYWVDEVDGDVARIPKRGGTSMIVYAGNGKPFASNSSIAVDTDVFWTAQQDKLSTLTRQDKNGGKPTVVASSTFASIESIAIDETSLYWLLGGGVVKETKSGGTPQALAGGFKGANAIALDGGHVYWSMGGTDANKFADGGIVESTKAGTNQQVLVRGADGASNVHSDGDNVYWQTGPKVYKASKAKGDLVKIAEGSGKVADIAIDDSWVYFLTPDAVARVPKTGGKGQTYVDGLQAPTSIIVDATSVYFTTRGTEANGWKDGTLQKIDK